MRIGRAGGRFFPIGRESDQSLDILQSPDDDSGAVGRIEGNDDNDNDDNDDINIIHRGGQGSRQPTPSAHGSLPPMMRQDSVFGSIGSSSDDLTNSAAVGSSGNRGLLERLVDTAGAGTGHADEQDDDDNDNEDTYEADFETTSESSLSPPKTTSIPSSSSSSSNNNASSSSSSRPFANWSMPNDYIPRVRFVEDVISDVFVVREKYARHEVPDLFYTHDESLKFTSDYNRESMKAEALGLTWYEWWENRTDEDVAKVCC